MHTYVDPKTYDIYIYIYIYIHTYIHVLTHTYIHTCMHACMHACIHIHIQRLTIEAVEPKDEFVPIQRVQAGWAYFKPPAPNDSKCICQMKIYA